MNHNNPRDHRLALAGMAAAMVLAIVATFSAGSMTHGFVSYYTASRLLVNGELGPQAYDDAWFGEVVRRLTNSDVREIFIPNPPTMAVMALPVAGLAPQPARAVWLFASLATFIAGVAGLVRHQRSRNRDITVPVLLLMLLAPAVFTNLRIGQGYLLVFGMFAATVVALLRQRDLMAGVFLGALLAMKTSGVALVALLVIRRRWTAVIASIAAAIVLATAITPFIDPAMWLEYPDHVRAYVMRPARSVTAYQTTLSLVRRLCVADPQWNPSPAASCAPIAFVVPALLTGGATLLTILFALRSTRPEPWLAAGATLSVLTLPAVAEPHFVLLAIPLALLQLRPVEIAVLAALLIVPLEWTAERFTEGWWALFAYPRLYAAWLIWAASIRELRRDATALPDVSASAAALNNQCAVGCMRLLGRRCSEATACPTCHRDAGTRRLSSSNQLSTTLIWFGNASVSLSLDHEEALTIGRDVVVGGRWPGRAALGTHALGVTSLPQHSRRGGRECRLGGDRYRQHLVSIAVEESAALPDGVGAPVV